MITSHHSQLSINLSCINLWLNEVYQWINSDLLTVQLASRPLKRHLVARKSTTGWTFLESISLALINQIITVLPIYPFNNCKHTRINWGFLWILQIYENFECCYAVSHYVNLAKPNQHFDNVEQKTEPFYNNKTTEKVVNFISNYTQHRNKTKNQPPPLLKAKAKSRFIKKKEKMLKDCYYLEEILHLTSSFGVKKQKKKMKRNMLFSWKGYHAVTSDLLFTLPGDSYQIVGVLGFFLLVSFVSFCCYILISFFDDYYYVRPYEEDKGEPARKRNQTSNSKTLCQS